MIILMFIKPQYNCWSETLLLHIYASKWISSLLVILFSHELRVHLMKISTSKHWKWIISISWFTPFFLILTIKVFVIFLSHSAYLFPFSFLDAQLYVGCFRVRSSPNLYWNPTRETLMFCIQNFCHYKYISVLSIVWNGIDNPKFKSCLSLFMFHFTLMSFRNAWIHLSYG